MIHYYEGTVFNVNAQTLVNTINCMGVMGKGIALEFKLRFPAMYMEYKKACEKGEVQTGKLTLYKETTELWIMNFPTKFDWKKPSKISYIIEGLEYFRLNYKQLNITSIAFPKLGTNNGGLDWEKEVKPIMEKYLFDLDIDVYICLDNKIEAEGIEKMMVDCFNQFSHDSFQLIGLKEKQTNILNCIKPLKRFYMIGDKKGIGKQTYEKLFLYFYKQAIDDMQLLTERKSKKFEQLSLFA